MPRRSRCGVVERLPRSRLDRGRTCRRRSQIRIALHTGPVFCGFDPIIGRDNYFGSSVTRAARIEPITPPGTVYASEAFAATLAASGRQDFGLEYVGQVALAKGYGESRVYRLTSR